MSQEDAQCGLDWDGRAEAGTPLGLRRFGIWVRWLTPPANVHWPSGPEPAGKRALPHASPNVLVPSGGCVFHLIPVAYATG
jgi:hypothetical protein